MNDRKWPPLTCSQSATSDSGQSEAGVWSKDADVGFSATTRQPTVARGELNA